MNDSSKKSRWSVIRCANGSVHLSYGLATLHVLPEDLGDLFQALAKVRDQMAQKGGRFDRPEPKDLH